MTAGSDEGLDKMNARRRFPSQWPTQPVPLARRAVGRRLDTDRSKVQSKTYLKSGTMVRVVGEHSDNFWYEVRLEGIEQHLWVDIDAVQPQRRREVVRRAAGPGTGRRRRNTHRPPAE